MPGKLPALARLGALGDLDLKDLRVHQILRRDTEPARGHLLDLRAAFGAIARRVLSAFTRIGAAAHPVHGNGQGLVGFRGQRPERHPGRIEPRQDGFHGLYFGQRHGLQILAQCHEVPEHGWRALVHEAGENLVALVVAGLHRRLQAGYDVGIVGVVLAAPDVLE